MYTNTQYKIINYKIIRQKWYFINVKVSIHQKYGIVNIHSLNKPNIVCSKD